MRRLLIHAVAYCGLLLAVTLAIPLDASFGSDDGAYGAEVYALRHGSWALDRPLPVVASENEGWLNGAVTPAGPTPYTSSPLYPLLLESVANVVHGPADTNGDQAAPAGDLGLTLHLPGLVAALVSACLAWRVASRWDRRAGPLAFWLLALGPILVDATTLWAHPLGTAVGGAAVLAVVELHRRPTDAARWHPWLAVLALALAAGCALRTEAVFWTIGLVAATLVFDRSRPMMAALTSCGGLALAVAGASRWWGRSLRSPRLPIETSVEALNGNGGWLATRLPAAWQLLMTWTDPTPGTLLAVVACLFALAGAILIRREVAAGRIPGAGGAPGSLGPVAFLGAAAMAYTAKAALAPEILITGLLAAWPIVPVALIAGGPISPRPPALPSPGATGLPARWLLVVSGLLIGAVLVTQYGSSGGLQWGGRYLSMAYVPLAAAAALAMVSAPGHDHQARSTRPFAAALLALTLIPAGAGLVASYRLHEFHHTVVAAVTDPPAEVVLTEIPALPRIAWTALPTAFYRADPTTIGGLLRDLHDAGVTTVNVVGMTDIQIDQATGFRVASSSQVVGGTVRHLTRTDATTTPGPLRSAEPVRPSPGAPVGGP